MSRYVAILLAIPLRHSLLNGHISTQPTPPCLVDIFFFADGLVDGLSKESMVENRRAKYFPQRLEWLSGMLKASLLQKQSRIS